MTVRNLPTFHALAAALAFAGVLAACADDDRKSSGARPETGADAGIGDAVAATDAGVDPLDDGSSDATVDADAAELRPDAPDAGGDTDAGADTDVDRGDVFDEDTLPDVAPDAGTDALPPDWLCDRNARVALCEAALLDDAPLAEPSNPDDLLFYVNRQRAVPAEYPVAAGSTWTPCDGGADPGGHDLICVPAEWNSGPRRALRAGAWSSAAPSDYPTTSDGRPVGFEGRIGFEAMFRAARAEADVELFVVSGFRSHETQVGLHESYVQREIDGGLDEGEARIVAATYSARPGHSEHQLGTTADITFRREDGSIFPGLSAAMGASRALQWVFRNAHRFGVVLTYGEHRVAETQYVYEPWHFRFVGVEAADQMRACELNTEEFLAARYGAGVLPPWGGEPWILQTDLTLVGHPTFAPGAFATAGTTIEKTWRVRNTGSVNWWYFDLEQTEGDVVASELAGLECVIAGAEADVTLSIALPAEQGVVEAEWMLRDPDGNAWGEPLPLYVDTRPPTAGGGIRYVRIEDLSNATGSSDPGADIDAIVAELPDGTEVYAERVIRYAASAPVVHGVGGDVLGAPDAFYDWPDTTFCGVDGGFASLGGSGEVIVLMPAALPAGTRVTVLEVGDCEYDVGRFAIPDEIAVSVGPAADGPWTSIASGLGPAVGGDVP
jgi:hypothetical protein